MRAYLKHVARDCERWVAYVRSRTPGDLRTSVAPADILGAATERALRYSESVRAESEAELDSWFRVIIHNVIQNLIDDQRRREEALRRWADAHRGAVLERPKLDRLSYEEFIERLDSVLSRLSAEAVLLFVDRCLSKKSFGELAETLGITEAAARSLKTGNTWNAIP